LRPCQLPPQPQKHPHRRHLPLCCVPQDLFQPPGPQEPPAHPFRDTASPLPRMRQGFPCLLPAQQPPSRPPKGEGANLWPLPAQLPQPGQLPAPSGDLPRPTSGGTSGGGSSGLNWDSGLDLTLLQAQGLVPNGLPKMNSLSFQGPSGSRSRGATGTKSHVCNQCGRGYLHASSLLNHKNSHKTGAYFCNSCQKEFPNLMSLKNHRRIHTEPKRFQCPDCGKSFRVSTQLICHRRIHTKEKPFSCQQCDKRFSSKSNLRHHQKVHWISLK
uniref:C2H2-type domain-containing protein n=1 Tax=Salmo trutta TaxID=8032 RepID=A0A673W223_SALTR